MDSAEPKALLQFYSQLNAQLGGIQEGLLISAESFNLVGSRDGIVQGWIRLMWTTFLLWPSVISTFTGPLIACTLQFPSYFGSNIPAVGTGSQTGL